MLKTPKSLGLAPVIALVLLAGSLVQLNSRLLFDPDEGRNAEVMREMAVTGDFIVPRLNGLLFLDKPFLYYASGGVSILLFGVNEAAVRIPGFLCTLATLVLVGSFARRSLGRSEGQAAALMLAAAPLVLAYTQIVIFDAMLTLWITTAVLAFYRAVDAGPGESGAIWSYFAWAAMALGVLTKGPVAILVPFAAVAPWAIWRGGFARLWSRGSPLVLVLLVGPWLWAVLREDPRFLHYAVLTETIGRLSTDELNRNAPIWYYLPVLLFGGFPWSLVVVAGWRDLLDAWRRREPTVLFLLSWLLVPLVLFSFMHSKRPHYVLPMLPALALLSLWLWGRRDLGEILPGVRAGALMCLVGGLSLLALGCGVAPGLLESIDEIDDRIITRTLVGVGVSWIVAGALAWCGRRSRKLALLGFALPTVALLVFSTALSDRIGEMRSGRALARAIEAAGPKGVEVVEIETSPPSLLFYLGRTVTLASRDASQLRSNYILRRYDVMVDRSPALRSPAWLEGAISDCDVDRLFVTKKRRAETHETLVGLGRPVIAETRKHRLYGGCVAIDEPPPAMSDALNGSTGKAE
jgi:4-amino-4-deoxy-L-arabinose transferase-like glycosyltransferase